MYVFERMNEQLFLDAFANSETRKNQFSREALRELFGFYDQLAYDNQEPIEFDMIAICCEWRELTISELAEASTDLAVRFLGTHEPDEVVDPTNGMLVLKVEHYKEPATYLVQSET